MQAGNIRWDAFSMSWEGELSNQDPPWKRADHEVWFRDPRAVIHNMLANPDFKDEIDYAPFREFVGPDGERQLKDFMSGDWAWNQAVCPFVFLPLCDYEFKDFRI